MRKAEVLAAMKAAGAQNDGMTFTRLFCEHRIGRKIADAAWTEGRRLAEICRQRDATHSE